jgi:hypothetical protein
MAVTERDRVPESSRAGLPRSPILVSPQLRGLAGSGCAERSVMVALGQGARKGLTISKTWHYTRLRRAWPLGPACLGELAFAAQLGAYVSRLPWRLLNYDGDVTEVAFNPAGDAGVRGLT